MATPRSEADEGVTDLKLPSIWSSWPSRKETALVTRQGTTWAGPGVAGFPALAITALANSRPIAYEALRFREVRDRIRHAQEIMVS